MSHQAHLAHWVMDDDSEQVAENLGWNVDGAGQDSPEHCGFGALEAAAGQSRSLPHCGSPDYAAPLGARDQHLDAHGELGLLRGYQPISLVVSDTWPFRTCNLSACISLEHALYLLRKVPHRLMRFLSLSTVSRVQSRGSSRDLSTAQRARVRALSRMSF